MIFIFFVVSQMIHALACLLKKGVLKSPCFLGRGGMRRKYNGRLGLHPSQSISIFRATRRAELIIPVFFSEQVDTNIGYTVLHIGTWELAIQCTVRTTILLYTIETVSYCNII
jgi:hypothetical protein